MNDPAEEAGRTTLSAAVALYLRRKGTIRPATFHPAAERARGTVIEACGDKDITRYTAPMPMPSGTP